MSKRRINRVLKALEEGTEEVRRNPSPSKYREWEQRLEQAGQKRDIWPWVLIVGVALLLICITPSLLSNLLSVQGNSEQWQGSSVISAPSGVVVATNRPVTYPTFQISSECPGAPTQRVRVGGRAQVCTKSDRLIVRERPGRNSREITRLYPGTYLTIIDGPSCADVYSWWKIRTDSGVVGWVAEGGDGVDPYFICPVR